MLAASDISFAYESDRPVLTGVSVSIRPGELTALIGPNGAGKSTLLRVLGGLAAPRSGGVTLDGQSVSTIPRRQRASRIAFVPQRTDVAFSFTVREVVRLGLFATAAGGDDAEVDRALALVGIGDRAGETIGALSAGQQQRATLARALAQGRLTQATSGAGVYLLADEPVSAMDPAQAMRAMSLLATLARRGAGIGCVLHDLSIVLRFAARVIVLGFDGRVVADGPARETLSPDLLQRVYGVRFDALSASGEVVAMVPHAAEDVLPA